MVRDFAEIAWQAVTAPVEPAQIASRLDQLAEWLDSAFIIPGTGIRFGADAVLSVIPGAGPLIGKALSSYLLIEAMRLGLPPRVVGRMLVNTGIDWAISSIPIIGLFGDVMFKANLRNMQILRAHLPHSVAA